MGIKIITDSSSDLYADYAAQNEIEILPLKIIFGEEVYDSGVNLSTPQFYEKLKTVTELPKTSQATPLELSTCFRRHLEAGDDVVAIFISSRMSGTYASASLIKQELGAENLYIVDSQTVTFALGILVMEAVRLVNLGRSAAEVYEEIERVKSRVVLYASIGNLKYLQMGGRMSSTTAFLGTMLNFKPIITIKDGLVESIDKQRGQKRAFDAVMALVEADAMDRVRPRIFAHTDAPELMEELMEHYALAFPKDDLSAFARCDIGPTVGVHAGPGAAGLAYFKAE